MCPFHQSVSLGCKLLENSSPSSNSFIILFLIAFQEVRSVMCGDSMFSW